MPKRIIILGSTGSIGRAALEVVAALDESVRVVGLAARRSWKLLAEQAIRFDVPAVAIAEPQYRDDLKQACPARTRVCAGCDGLMELIAGSDANLVLSAIVGAAGLPATLAAVERGIDVGLANKESLVVAGELIMPLARERSSTLIPIDSEHSAIFQAMMCGRRGDVQRIHLTASGGPFRSWPRERIEHATLEEALNHPTWNMGPKITIDSATMMNKALEIIEARHLFGLEANQINVLIHPQSIVHSMVEYRDGSLIAQLSTPDMRTPIQYAITYPRRVAGVAPAMNWSEVQRLEFEPPDLERFGALRLGFEAARLGGCAGAVLNAANEAAVEQFRAGRIRFGAITHLTEQVFERHERVEQPTLEALFEADAWARQEVIACMGR